MKLARCIREATSEDSAGLSKCMQAAYASYQARMGGVRLPPMDADYSSEIKNYPTWVVESQGDVLGGLIMAFENDQAAITSAVGHLVELKMPTGPNGKNLPWKFDVLPAIPRKFELQPTPPSYFVE